MRGMWIAWLLLAGCPSNDEPPACTTVDTTCAPLYEPTFANVYANTLRMDCGGERSACHSATGQAGGVSFADEDAAYAALVTRGRVTPADPACSELIVRAHDVGTDYQMPPGDPLDDAEVCALIQWVQAGALR